MSVAELAPSALLGPDDQVPIEELGTEICRRAGQIAAGT
jgi:hypothetical protein